MTAIANLERCSLKETRIFLPEQQLARESYLQIQRAIQGIGGIWSRKEQAFVFDSDPSSLWARVLAGEEIDLLREFKKRTQFFATPKEVVRLMMEYFDIGAGYAVLEPSAGDGGIADVLQEEFSTYPWTLHTVEKEETLRNILERKGHTVVGEDFMELLAMPLYDLIVANPPFSKGQDMLHIMQMIKHLKPGGRIVSLMRNIEVDDRKIRDANPKTLTHQGRIHKQFIEFLDNYGFYSTEKVPAGAFAASGTSIPTQIFVIDRPLYD
jgi:hypothetical protein